MWDEIDLRHEKERVMEEIHVCENKLYDEEDKNKKIIKLNDYIDSIDEALSDLNDLDELRNEIDNGEKLVYDDGTLITYEVLEEERNSIFELINNYKQKNESTKIMIKENVFNKDNLDKSLNLTKEIGTNIATNAIPVLDKVKDKMFKVNHSKMNSYIYNYYHSSRFTTLLSNYMLDYSRIVHDFMSLNEESNRMRGYARKSEEDMSHYNKLTKEVKDLEALKNKTEVNIRAIASTPSIFKLRGGLKDVKTKLMFGFKALPFGYLILLFILSMFVVGLFFGNTMDKISIGIISLPIFIIGMIFLSSFLFNRRARKMKNENDLDLYEMYQEIDSALYTLTLEENPLINHLILQIKNPFVKTMERIASGEKEFDEDLNEYVTKHFDIRTIKISGFNGRNGGDFHSDSNMGDNGFDDNFGGSSDFDDMFDSGMDDWASDFIGDNPYEDYTDEELTIKDKMNKIFKFEKIDKTTNELEISKEYKKHKIVETEDTVTYVFNILGIPHKTYENNKGVIEGIFGMEIYKIYDKFENRVGDIGVEFVKNPLPLMIPFDDSPNTTFDSKIIIGKSVREWITWDFDVTPHGMVVGGTGGGKSVAMNFLIQQLIKKEELLFFVDFKGGTEFGVYEDVGYPVIQDVETYLELLKKLHDEVLTERLKLMKQYKAKNVERLNELLIREGKEPLKRIVLVLDEYADVKSIENESKEMKELVGVIESYFGRILAKSRSSRINVIVGTQRPDAKTFGSGAFRDNILFRMVGKMASTSGSQMSLETDTAFTDIPDNDEKRGMFIIKGSNIDGEVKVRIPFLDEDSYDELFENVFKEICVGDYIDMSDFINKANNNTYIGDYNFKDNNVIQNVNVIEEGNKKTIKIIKEDNEEDNDDEIEEVEKLFSDMKGIDENLFGEFID